MQFSYRQCLKLALAGWSSVNYYHNIIWRGIQTWTFFIIKYSPISCYCLLVCSKYLSQHHVIESFNLLAFLHLRNQVSQLYKTSRIMFFRLKPEKIHLKLNGNRNSKYLTFVHIFLHASLICRFCSIFKILKIKICKATILPLVYVGNRLFLILKNNF